MLEPTLTASLQKMATLPIPEIEPLLLECWAVLGFELRTPLNAVIGFSEILANKTIGPNDDRYIEYAKSIYTSALSMLEMINDTLQTMKIASGLSERNDEDLEIGEVINEVLDNLAESCHSHNMIMHFSPGDIELTRVKIDKKIATQILQNILLNSIDFGDPGGFVKITISASAAGLDIVIKDTGMGIMTGKTDKCYPNTYQRLRLPVAKLLVESYGGQLRVESSRTDVGLTCFLSFPGERVVSAAG